MMLLNAVKDFTLTHLNLSACNLPGSCTAAVADIVRGDGRISKTIEELIIDSTGTDQGKTYTLSAASKSIDLSNRNLGPEDCDLLGAWLDKSQVQESLTSVNISGNRAIGSGNPMGVVALIGSFTNCRIADLNMSNCRFPDLASGEKQIMNCVSKTIRTLHSNDEFCRVRQVTGRKLPVERCADDPDNQLGRWHRRPYVFGAACFVYTCRRLIDLSNDCRYIHAQRD